VTNRSLTPRSKTVLELASAEAEKMGHDYVGTEHILLGLLREGEGIAAIAMMNNNINIDKLRDEIARIVKSDHVPEKPIGRVKNWFVEIYLREHKHLVKAEFMLDDAAAGKIWTDMTFNPKRAIRIVCGEKVSLIPFDKIHYVEMTRQEPAS